MTAATILALETSQTAGSVALVQGEKLLAQIVLESEQKSAKALAPALERLLRETGCDERVSVAGSRPRDLLAIAVNRGPGSFTGLRIGVTTAKLLAWAWQLPLVAVTTGELLAAQVIWERGEQIQKLSLLEINNSEAVNSVVSSGVLKISTIVDAHRQQLFVADFTFDPASGTLCELTRPHLENIADRCAALANIPREQKTILVGPALAKLKPKLEPLLSSGTTAQVSFAAESCCTPWASSARVWRRSLSPPGMLLTRSNCNRFICDQVTRKKPSRNSGQRVALTFGTNVSVAQRPAPFVFALNSPFTSLISPSPSTQRRNQRDFIAVAKHIISRDITITYHPAAMREPGLQRGM